MKKKIGSIDYYIDEWHANNYPRWIRESGYKDQFDVALAWEEMTPAGKKPLAQWAQEQGVGVASSIEQVIAECDCLVVLSPDNAERHEDLADLPLRSGKPVYIDKPIAPTLAAAARLFKKAEAHNTPMMSCSALRFGSEINKAVNETMAGQPVHFASTRGGGVFHIYAIHQFEMLVMALGTGAKRVMQVGNQYSNLMVADYGDGRRGSIDLVWGHPFQFTIQYGDKAGGSSRPGGVVVANDVNDFWPYFVDGLLQFFSTGKPLVPKEQTLEIAALIEAGTLALDKLDTWVDVPRP